MFTQEQQPGLLSFPNSTCFYRDVLKILGLLQFLTMEEFLFHNTLNLGKSLISKQNLQILSECFATNTFFILINHNISISKYWRISFIMEFAFHNLYRRIAIAYFYAGVSQFRFKIMEVEEKKLNHVIQNLRLTAWIFDCQEQEIYSKMLQIHNGFIMHKENMKNLKEHKREEFRNIAIEGMVVTLFQEKRYIEMNFNKFFDFSLKEKILIRLFCQIR
ncbi:unnamed protein product [Paramecium octaurelia]|uniref:Uncharacterized protein n=1 Tax=Paramecium octaurelia TaxID=43137 RepID=A0A8S1YMB7_PAROT|nr:unnamed protein product [Paramecium octaurelia]